MLDLLLFEPSLCRDRIFVKMLNAKIVLIVLVAAIMSVKCTSLVGGVKTISGDELKKSIEVLETSLTKLAAGDGPFLKLSKVHNATKQVVAGMLYKYDAEFIDGNSAVKKCKVEIWSRVWIKENGNQVTFECEGEEKIVKTHSA